ncbi:MAG: tetratricopeptide repeat protein [Treponema sp.]|nr:tetratricopeptide repeat protein [Treponema sp.]
MTENQTSSSKLNGFLEKNKKVLVGILIAVVVCLAAYIIITAVGNSTKEKNLAEIEEITYTLTHDSASLEEGELNARRIDAIDNLAAYTKKSGIVGARANYLCAELYYQQKNYESAINCYKATATKSAKNYLAPVAYYNLGVCYEQLNNLDEAAANYKLAADSKVFALVPHAKYSYARVIEASGNKAEAVTAYTELYDAYPNDNWGKLAKTRLIDLKAQGKAE